MVSKRKANKNPLTKAAPAQATNLKYKVVDRPDIEDYIFDELRSIWAIDPIIGRLLSFGNIVTWQYDQEDPATMAQVAMAPGSLLRDRIRTTVSPEGELTLIVNSDWFDQAAEAADKEGSQDIPMQLMAQAERLIHRHDKRFPGSHERNSLFGDASQMAVEEIMHRYFGFDRNRTTSYVPSEHFPESLYAANVDGERYRGILSVEPIFRHLLNIIPVEEDPPSQSNGPSGPGGGNGDDDGDGSGSDDGANGGVSSEGLDKLLENVAEASTDQELQDHNEGQAPAGKHAGTGDSTFQREFDARKVVKKRRWQEVIQIWSRKVIAEREAESWIRNPHHMQYTLEALGGRIPAKVVQELHDKRRVPVAVFCDSSGSVYHIVDRMFKAALSLPADTFDVHLYCFDTRIHPVDLRNPKVMGGGGTYFSIINTEVERLAKEINEYPYVFVLTDGYAEAIHPREEQAHRWKWFLTPDHTTSAIPKNHQIYDLSNYE